MLMLMVPFLTGLLPLRRLLPLRPVPPVFDLVVATVGAQVPRNLRPPLPALAHHPHDLPPFVVRDGGAVEPRLEVLCVPLPTLLGRPNAHTPRNARPVGPVRGVQFQEEDIFLALPVPLVECLV